MQKNDSISAATSFNDRIHRRDLDRLADLMSADHVFIDSGGEILSGKEEMLSSWENFFEQSHDCHNHFEQISVRGELCLISGHSTCSFEPLDGPALRTPKDQRRPRHRMACVPGHPGQPSLSGSNAIRLTFQNSCRC